MTDEPTKPAEESPASETLGSVPEQAHSEAETVPPPVPAMGDAQVFAAFGYTVAIYPSGTVVITR